MKRSRGIEKDPEYQRADAEALGEDRFARLWLPSLGRWDIRVSRFFLWIGIALAAAAILVVILTTSARPAGGAVLAVPIMVALTGWSLARWFGGANYPTEHTAGWVRSVVVWFVIAWVAQRVLLAIVPDPSAFGQDERWFMVPFTVAVAVVVGARLHLRWWVTALAGAYFALVFLGSVGEDPVREVDTLGAAPLQRLAATGEAGVLLRSGAKPGTVSGGAPSAEPTRSLDPPSTAVVTAPPGSDCEAIRGKDVHRTALGLRGRTIAFRAEVCWDAKGRPISATVDEQYDAGHEAGDLRPVRLENLDAFTAPSRFDHSGLRVGRGEGYGARGGGGQEDPTAGGDPSASTVIAHVSRDGRTVELAFAFETRDPLVTGRSAQEQGGTNAAGETVTGATPDRLFSLRARDGYALDIVAVTVVRGRSLGAALLRTTSHGSRQLAIW